jgi:cytochrome c5
MRLLRFALVPACLLPAEPGLALDGRTVYVQACAACHAAGVAGAPRLGDRLAWEPRLRAGVEGLLAAVLKGKGAMPPKGGNANVSDADARAAVEYMIGAAR